MIANMILRARNLRNNLTEAEKYIWYMLRSGNLGAKFRRQAVIGRYIVDFVCYEKRLIIEVDGGQHADSMADKERDEWLKREGFEVLRFWNNDVLENREGVLEKIIECLTSPSLTLPTSPAFGGARGRETRWHAGQAIMEFTFCMIVALLMIYGMAMIFRWVGMDFAGRRVGYENSLFSNVVEEYGICLEWDDEPSGCLEASGDVCLWTPCCPCLDLSTPEDGPLKQLEGSFYTPARMNAVWGGE